MKALYIPILLFTVLILQPGSAQAQCTDLFFSEYIEGSSNNKILEIYNPTASGIDLSAYQITLYSNGNVTPGNTLNWPSGTILGAGEVYVIANGSADSIFLLHADTISTVTYYNGDDAIVLSDTVEGSDIDIIGVIGEQPGGGWPVGTGTTQNNTLVRKSSVNDGQTNWSVSVLGWDVYPSNFADSLGSHSIDNCNATSSAIASFQTSSGNGAESVHGADTAWVSLTDIDQNYDISVALMAGSATSSVDFDLVEGSGVYSITTGQTSLAIPFIIYDDGDDEGNETFAIQISEGTGGVTIGNDEFIFTIIDDDTPPTAACTHPFFSEYIEGSSNNKLLEIYNPTEAAIDMSNYRINRYNNGNDGSEDTSGVFNWAPGTMLAAGDVHVIANPSSDSILLTLADTTNSITFYNGDDVLELEHISTLTIVDVIGERGVDPGTNWPVGEGATSEYTLVRNPNVHGGQTNWFLGAMTWLVYPTNFADSLGAHYMIPCGVVDPCEGVTIMITGNVTNETVEDADDGAIDITASGGTTPYTYSWDNGSMMEDISGLADDTYTVTVTDSAGCSGTAVFTVMPGPGPCTGVTINVTGTVTDESVMDAGDGSVDISVSGGTMPYTYSWDNGAMTEDIDNLIPDTYTVTVTDSAGCTGTEDFTVMAGPGPCDGVTININGSVTDESVDGADDGAVDITVSGGTTPYTYSWSNGAMTEDIDNLAPNTYTVTVTDSAGCTGMNSFIVNAGGDPCTGVNIQVAVSATSESAAGAGDGAIDITVTGGTMPYDYDWSNGATTEDIDMLDPDTYTVTVTDSEGCTGIATVIIGAGPVAVNDIGSLKIFNVYPNPASDRFNVELQFNTSEEITLDITDITGRVVFEKHAGVVRSANYPIYTNWPAGMYFLKIKAGDNVAVEPVMIY